MQSKQDTRRFLDFSDSSNIQALPGFSPYDAFQHAMHVTHGRSQGVDSGGFDEHFASAGTVRPFERSGAFSRISEPTPMSPSSPLTRMARLMALRASTASLGALHK
jgi:hypothetical protein